MTILNNPTPYTFEEWSANANDLVAVIDGGDGSDLHPFYKQFIWDSNGFGYGGYGNNFILIDNEGRIFMDRWPNEYGESVTTNNINTFNEMLDFIYVYGCTDPTAENYDVDANVDNGSCTYPEIIYGCMDSNADNYNPDATQNDGSCLYNPGCMDPLAENYDPEAQIDDGSCYYLDDVLGCMNIAAENYNTDATVDDGSCIFAEVYVQGCVDYRALNWNKYASIDDGSCQYIHSNEHVQSYGSCKDILAINYNVYNPNEGPCYIHDGQGRPENFCCVYKMPNRIYPAAQVKVLNQGTTAKRFGFNVNNHDEDFISGRGGAYLYCESYWINNLNQYWGFSGGSGSDTQICGEEGCITGNIACNYFYEDCDDNCIGQLVPNCSGGTEEVFNCFTYQLYGDMNNDGLLNVLDLVAWISKWESFNGISPLLLIEYPEMDIDGDGLVIILDLIVLLNMILEVTGTTQDRNQIVKLLDNFMIKNNLSSVDREEILKVKKTLIGDIEEKSKLRRELNMLPSTLQPTDNKKQKLIDKILRRQKNG